jgi:hypothetical protein
MGNPGQVLTSNGDAVPTWVTPTDVDLAIGGSDKQLQYNNNGAFGGVSNGNADEVMVSNGAGAIPSFKVFGKLLHGVIPPVDATDGVNGDFFMDTAAENLYGPKAGGVWPGGVTYKGSQGIQGIQGIQGVAGTGYLALEVVNSKVSNNVTSLTTLCAFTNLTSGLLNTLNRKLIIEASGSFTTDVAETPQITFDLHMAAASQAAIQTAALTGSAVGAWKLKFETVTYATGAGGSILRSGELAIQLAGTDVVTKYVYAPLATNAIDPSGVLGPIITIAATSNLKQMAATMCTLKVE